MDEKPDKPRPSLRSTWASPWVFFCLVFCWIATAASGISVLSTLGKGLELVGLLGSMLGGIGFAYLTQNSVLDRLQARWNALASSLILGAIWALYHLPLFYMKDTYH